MKKITTLLLLLTISISVFAKKPSIYIGTWEITSIYYGDSRDIFKGKNKRADIKQKTQAYIKKYTGAVITLNEDMTVEIKLKGDSTTYKGTWQESTDTERSIAHKQATGDYYVTYRVIDIKIPGNIEMSLFAKVKGFKKKKGLMELNYGSYFYSWTAIPKEP